MSVDIWAIGCIFAEFFIKKHLFDGVNDMDQLKQMVDRLGAPNSKFIHQQSLSPILNEIFSKAQSNRCIDEIFPLDIFPPDDASNVSANGNIFTKK
jgi:serine/threonine protein kinase